MKIIKDGRSENTPKQVTCNRCRSVLEVTPADIFRKSYDQRDGDAYIFKCAACGNDIWLDMRHAGWNGI